MSWPAVGVWYYAWNWRSISQILRNWPSWCCWVAIISSILVFIAHFSCSSNCWSSSFVTTILDEIIVSKGSAHCIRLISVSGSLGVGWILVFIVFKRWVKIAWIDLWVVNKGKYVSCFGLLNTNFRCIIFMNPITSITTRWNSCGSIWIKDFASSTTPLNLFINPIDLSRIAISTSRVQWNLQILLWLTHGITSIYSSAGWKTMSFSWFFFIIILAFSNLFSNCSVLDLSLLKFQFGIFNGLFINLILRNCWE